MLRSDPYCGHQLLMASQDDWLTGIKIVSINQGELYLNFLEGD